MQRITLVVAFCGLVGLLLACGGGGGETSKPTPAVLTNPISFGTADPVQALHWLINAYDPVLAVPASNSSERKKVESNWQNKLQHLRGTQVSWALAVGSISAGKVSPVRTTHPYDEATLRDNPDLAATWPQYALEPLAAGTPPTRFFEATGVPEWLQQVQVGTPILLTGTIHSVEVDSAETGKSMLRFKVLLDSAAATHR